MAASRWWPPRRTPRLPDRRSSCSTAQARSAAGWPRYNTGSDATFNGVGNNGYGAYGENVGIGNLDNDPQREIVVTFDNHQINVFNHDGTSVLASPWYTNRDSDHLGSRLGWGQFIRWLSPSVEADHYHRHVGPWPDVRKTPWLQWTASPPSVADLDRDGRNEVIGLPNVEQNEPYETQAYAFMVLDGAQGSGGRSARRHKGFRTPPLSGKPAVRPDGDWYPPSGIPAPSIVNIGGNRRPEIVASVPDGHVYAVGPGGKRLWRYDYARGAPKTFASEVVAADLNRNGVPELIFGTYGPSPDRAGWWCSPHRASGSMTSACATRGATGTASACPPRPPSATSTATAASRSWSRPSTTGSTCTACRARTPSACHGRPAAAISCATAPGADAGIVGSFPSGAVPRLTPIPALTPPAQAGQRGLELSGRRLLLLFQAGRRERESRGRRHERNGR